MICFIKLPWVPCAAGIFPHQLLHQFRMSYERWIAPLEVEPKVIFQLVQCHQDSPASAPTD